EHKLVAAIATGKRSIAHFCLNLSCPRLKECGGQTEKTPPKPRPGSVCTQTHTGKRPAWVREPPIGNVSVDQVYQRKCAYTPSGAILLNEPHADTSGGSNWHDACYCECQRY